MTKDGTVVPSLFSVALFLASASEQLFHHLSRLAEQTQCTATEKGGEIGKGNRDAENSSLITHHRQETHDPHHALLAKMAKAWGNNGNP